MTGRFVAGVAPALAPGPRRAAIAAGLLLAPLPALAGGDAASAATMLALALVLVLARVGSLVERIGQPAVLGELLAGVLLGNVALAGFGATGALPAGAGPADVGGFLASLRADPMLRFLADLGVVVLLFQIGLESDVATMRRVGARAFAVAVVGVVAPFALGALLVGPWLFPQAPYATHLFLGAALTATSVGITARVFRDMGVLRTPEAQIVLGAAVIDDVIGLVILAVVSAIVTTDAVDPLSIVVIVAKALGFLVGAIVIGQAVLPRIGRTFARVSRGAGMKFTLAIAFCLFLSWAAHAIGLAAIVGAFAAGLILDEATFEAYDDPDLVPEIRTAVAGAPGAVRDGVEQVLARHAHHHLDALVAPVGNLLVPVFFVWTGLQVDLRALADPATLAFAAAVTVAAFAGKLLSGTVAGAVDRLTVGWAMAPRGEVGLIFAVAGKQLGVVDDRMFSVIVLMVMATTLATPIILARRLRGPGRPAAG